MIRTTTLGVLVVLAASTAKAAACDWTTAVYEPTVSDACQKDLESKATNEQDKVYVRRMFKEWQPLPKSMEVMNDHGFIQLSDESTGYLFQAQWMAQKPAILWINGAMVTDASTDPSLYRKLDRMMDAAEQKSTSTAWMNPFRSLFMSDAQAATARRAQNMVYLYTLNNGFTGTAEEILTGKDNEGKLVGSALPDHQHWWGRDTYQCTGKTIADTEYKVDGKDLKIHQNTASEFTIKGLIDGQDVKVDMKGRPMYPAELKEVHTNKKTGRRFTRIGLPCQGKYSEELAEACKDKWTEWASMHPEAKAYLAAGGDKAKYGKDYKCTDLYKPLPANSDKEEIRTREQDLRTCKNFFRASFPQAGVRYQENTASFSLCVEQAGKQKCNAVKSAEDVVKTSDPKLAKDKREVNLQVATWARTAYRDALKKAGYDNLDDYCKLPQTPTVTAGAVDDFGRGPVTGETTYSRCSFPAGKVKGDKNTQAQLLELQKQANNPNKVEVESVTADFKSKIESRLLGLMMLGDCCGNQTCSEKLARTTNIDLKKTPAQGGNAHQ